MNAWTVTYSSQFETLCSSHLAEYKRQAAFVAEQKSHALAKLFQESFDDFETFLGILGCLNQHFGELRFCEYDEEGKPVFDLLYEGWRALCNASADTKHPVLCVSSFEYLEGGSLFRRKIRRLFQRGL
jgi:hypothetical protein